MVTDDQIDDYLRSLPDCPYTPEPVESIEEPVEEHNYDDDLQ